MDFGELLEYLAPLAFLLIALFNSFLKKRKSNPTKSNKKVENKTKKEIKSFKDLMSVVKEEINAEKNTYNKIEEETPDNIIIEKPKELKKSPSKEIDNLDKDNSINDLKKVNKFPNLKTSLIKKLKNKENIKDGIILKEILKRKF
jgi:NADH dehydrogenase/NADH:ubiquinone oxidoreductase subunit G